MVFVLDNYDSFTYNLVQYMGELGAEMVVRRNDELTPAEVEALDPSHILISPGPCTPEDAGISIELIRHFARLAQAGGQRVPILGVCLGHQAIGAAFGGKVVRAPKLMHGKTSEVEHDGRTIFAGIASPMICTRYHSLIVAEEGLPEELEVSARTVGSEASGGGAKQTVGHAGKQTASHAGTTIMALRHRQLPIEGVQFHPESVLTVHGKKIIANFLKM
jgi:anthranilate synthase component 2